MQRVRGCLGSSNFVIDPGVSWPVTLMSLTPLIQEFKTLLQNGVSKQQQGRCQDIIIPKKKKNSAHSTEETQLWLFTLIHKHNTLSQPLVQEVKNCQGNRWRKAVGRSCEWTRKPHL